MIFAKRFKELRKASGFSQEGVAECLTVSRQAVAKWEAGLTLPDIDHLIVISELFQVSMDSLVKKMDGYAFKEVPISKEVTSPIIEFLCEAKLKTYASLDRQSSEREATKPGSRDLIYQKDDFMYQDTYVGGSNFSGIEGIWEEGVPIWSMNYIGRALDAKFSSTFLKEALQKVPQQMPFRGPEFYQRGNYTYICSVLGDFNWFQGSELIFYEQQKVYELLFQGGQVQK